MVVQVQQQRYAEVYDFSINLNAEMYRGLLKAGRYTVPGSEAKGWDILKKKVAVPGPLYYWFAAQTEGVPLKPEKYSPGHDDGFILSVADFSKTAELIYAINAGERMQFALKYKGDKLDRVVAFKPDLAADDRQAIKACLLGMSERIEAELQEATPAK